MRILQFWSPFKCLLLQAIVGWHFIIFPFVQEGSVFLVCTSPILELDHLIREEVLASYTHVPESLAPAQRL